MSDTRASPLSIAREKAAGRGIDAEFVVADALHLDRLGRVFDTVLAGCSTRSTAMSGETTSRVWRP